MIANQEREEIRREAKTILDNFVRLLEEVDIKEQRIKKVKGGYREEKIPERCDEDFRNIFFENAPQKNKDCIIVEKKKW